MGYSTKHQYGLYEVLSFGKYKHQLVEAVIIKDPKYILWALNAIEGFDLQPDADDLLRDMLEDLEG